MRKLLDTSRHGAFLYRCSSTTTAPFPSPFVHGYHLQTSLLYFGFLTLLLTLRAAFPFLHLFFPLPLPLTLHPSIPFPSGPLPLPAFQLFPSICSLPVLFFPATAPPPLFTPSSLYVYMPIICPRNCYIGLYACTISSYIGFATRDDVYDVITIHAYTVATHDAIIIVSSCWGQPSQPMTGRLRTRHPSNTMLHIYTVSQKTSTFLNFPR